MNSEYEKLIEDVIASHPPVKEGYTRIYEDHTYRNYQDFSPEEMKQMFDDPLLKIVREEVQKEINKEIVSKIKGQS